MKKIISILTLLVSTPVLAEVLDVSIFNPMPGKAQVMAQTAQEAKAIQEKLGANTSIAFDIDGRMHYVSTFENWQAWTAHGDKLDSSEEWQALGQKIGANPSAVREDRYLLNTVASAEPTDMYQVFIWEPQDGKALGAVIESAMKAKAIHEKGGAKISINVDQMQRMHYVMNFESWDAWAKFQDSPAPPEWNEYWTEASKDPAGKLVKVYTASY